jgi:hypothetical protein
MPGSACCRSIEKISWVSLGLRPAGAAGGGGATGASTALATSSIQFPFSKQPGCEPADRQYESDAIYYSNPILAQTVNKVKNYFRIGDNFAVLSTAI